MNAVGLATVMLAASIMAEPGEVREYNSTDIQAAQYYRLDNDLDELLRRQQTQEQQQEQMRQEHTAMKQDLEKRQAAERCMEEIGSGYGLLGYLVNQWYCGVE